jgi:hypothetical protein
MKFPGKYSTAEELHQQALQLSEKLLGWNHPGTMNCENRLHNCLRPMNKDLVLFLLWFRKHGVCLCEKEPTSCIYLFRVARPVIRLNIMYIIHLAT